MNIPQEALTKFANGADVVNDETTETPEVETTTETSPAPTMIDPGFTETDDDDDDVVIAGIDTAKAAEGSNVSSSAADEFNHIIEQEMKGIKEVNPEHYDAVSTKILDEIKTYRRDLIVNEGLTPEEADKAAKNRATTSAKNEVAEYYKEHPEIAVIEVDSTTGDKIEFTPEQEKKLDIVKRIKLVKIEDESLNVLNIKDVKSRKEKFNIIHRASCNLAHYELPFYNACDYMTFNGANILQLSNAVMGETDDDGSPIEPITSIIQKKGQFLYDHFNNSTLHEKYDIDGNIIFTYEDFMNWFKYDDMDTGIYAIYVASSTEMITSAFNCFSTACTAGLPAADVRKGRPFEATYNSKGIITFENAGDHEKEVIDSILGAKNNIDAMKAVNEKYSTKFRARSTYTQNVYEFAAPSINDALVTFEATGIEPYKDSENINPDHYINVYSMWTRAIYVYSGDNEKGEPEYVAITDIEDIIDYYRNIVETERAIVNYALDENTYYPLFRIKTKCPNCGNESQIPLDVSQLVFLRRHSVEAEIAY